MGALASEDYAGNVGNQILDRFKCTIDYDHKTVYLEPGKRYAKRDQFSRAGTFSNLVVNLGTVTAGTMGRSVTSLSFSPDGKVLASGGVESKSNLDAAVLMGGAMNNVFSPARPSIQEHALAWCNPRAD